jgi:hypothetical protein
MPEPQSLEMSELQAKYLRDAVEQKARIERDILISVHTILAGHGVDAVEGMGYSIDGNKLMYAMPTLPDEG